MDLSFDRWLVPGCRHPVVESTEHLHGIGVPGDLCAKSFLTGDSDLPAHVFHALAVARSDLRASQTLGALPSDLDLIGVLGSVHKHEIDIPIPDEVSRTFDTRCKIGHTAHQPR